MNTYPIEHERRLQSIINRGIVTQVDHAAARCRVQIDGLETDWLKFTSARIGKVKIWNPPSIGEQVLVISETGELSTGLVTTSFDYDDQPMPSANADTFEIHCDDGAAFVYNHATHNLGVILPDDSTTTLVSSRVQISARDVSFDCNNFDVNCSSYSLGCKSYSLDSQTSNQNGTLTINGQPYLEHSHAGVKSGRSNTGGVNA
ncbi:phage baseplate assembly protein V [Psychrobacter sp. HII-4]|uniref:phage baseplate assembly protein V n=1 Tax=Psychrobacter sp. HII-4 TaxID=1569264 RepID=UPI0019191920|nr:phage baseplate assembly protein V [Psychrobacter sp. HII-4]